MKRIVILLLALITLGTTLAQTEIKKERKDIKCISFNIRLGSEWAKQHDGPNFWDNRKEAVVRMIKQESPDIIGMQEVLPNQLQYLDSALRKRYIRIGVGREDGKLQGECMAVYFSKKRFKLDSSATYWLSQTPDVPSMGWDAACHRTVTIMRLIDRRTHKPLLYMNTHLDHVSTTARANSTMLLAKWAKEWGADKMPVIIGGDMNTAAEDPIFENLFSNGFTKARNSARYTDNHFTYTGFGKDTPSQIDHYFIRNLDVKQFRTLNGDYGVPYISDHYPIMMIVARPEE